MTEFFTLQNPSISLKPDSPLSADLAKFARLTYLDKNETILLTNTRQEYVYFILKGYVRSYFKGADGSETTCWFFGKGDMAFSDSSVLYDRRSPVSFQTTCATKAFQIETGDFMFLRNSYPEFNRLCLHLMGNFHSRMFEYAHTLLRLPRAGRFALFLHQNPGIFGQVKEKDVANFLHMHPNSFSEKKGML